MLHGVKNMQSAIRQNALMPISTLIDMPCPKAAMQGQLQLLSSLVHISSYQDIFDNCNVADQVMLTYTLVSF